MNSVRDVRPGDPKSEQDFRSGGGRRDTHPDAPKRESAGGAGLLPDEGYFLEGAGGLPDNAVAWLRGLASAGLAPGPGNGVRPDGAVIGNDG